MSTPAVYILEQLQSIVVGLLANDDLFLGNQSANGAAIPIITEDIGDLMTELTIKIDSTGICAIVQTPEFEFTNEWASQPGAISYDGMASIDVMVIENVTLNRATGGTNIPARSVAERIVRLLHGQPTGLPDNPNSPSHFMGRKKPLQKTNEGPPLVYITFFQAHVTLLTPSI
jgi:hypothetical protein